MSSAPKVSLDELRSHFRSDQVSVDVVTLAQNAHDDAEWAPYVAPFAVVFAESTEDVASVVLFAGANGLSVVARGAGTGPSGGANSSDNWVIVTLERMAAALEVNVDERYAIAQAGVINNDLRQVVAEAGLWYLPDPASFAISTIGGNAATNAAGICCVKYGVTRDYVLGLTVVLADGSIVRVGRKTAKGVTGYDLTALLVGSEGTLGIITEVTVKLLPLVGREERRSSDIFRRCEPPGMLLPRCRGRALFRPRSSSLIAPAFTLWRSGSTSGFPRTQTRSCWPRSTTLVHQARS